MWLKMGMGRSLAMRMAGLNVQAIPCTMENYMPYICFKATNERALGNNFSIQIVSYLLSINLQGLLIWVLNDNPSRYFYESLGGQLVRERNIEIGGQHLQLSAYGWNHLNELKVLLQNW